MSAIIWALTDEVSVVYCVQSRVDSNWLCGGHTVIGHPAGCLSCASALFRGCVPIRFCSVLIKHSFAEVYKWIRGNFGLQGAHQERLNASKS